MVSPFVDLRHGTERVLAELLVRLAKEYDCVIHLYSQRVSDLKVDHPQGQSDKTRPGIYWHRVPSFPGPHLVQFLIWLVTNSCCRWWNNNLRREHCDLLLSPGINCFDADVIIVHALFHRVWELSQVRTTKKRGDTLRKMHRRAYYQFLVWLERLIYSDSRVGLGAVSHRTARLLEAKFDRRNVSVLPNAVDLVTFSPEERRSRREAARRRWGLLDHEIVLLLIGNDWYVKGLPTVLAAMDVCRIAHMKLLVVGADDQGPFRETIERLGLFDRVTFVAQHAHVISLYAAADIYVSPTREDAFALPPLEAMACGLPVITSSSNGGCEVIHDGVDGFVLEDPTDSSALAGVFTRLVEDNEFRIRMGAAAASTAKACTWERNAAKTWEFLNEVLRIKGKRSREETGRTSSGEK